MARKNDVELVISAKNETDKTFKQVQESLSDITTALAKKPGGVSGFFDGIEKKLEGIVNQKKKVDAALNDTAAIQKAINKQKEFVEAIAAQETTVTKAQVKLSELKAEFVGIEKAANTARTPNEKLTKSLDNLNTKQSSLGDSISSTRQAIEQANAALAKNAGLDDKATAAIAKQEAKLLSTGTAWREITKEVGLANKALVDIASRRDSNEALRKEGEVRVASLKAQLAAAKELNKEFQKQARKEGAGEATRSLARSSSASVKGLTDEYNAARQAQAELVRQANSLNAELKKQEAVLESTKTKAAAQKKAYDALKVSVAAFAQAQQQEGVTRQQAGIDKMVTSLTTLEAQYAATTAKISAANQAITKASGVDPKAVAQRDAYKVKIDQAIQAVQKEQQELTDLKAKMDAAGLSTAALAARQKELDVATERLTKDQKQLGDQIAKVDATAKRTGASLGGIGKTFLGIGDDTRKSLGYLQRIRGELLSIVATTTGLYAVGGAIKSIYDTSVLFSKAESRFSVFFKGDATAVKSEIDFVKKLTDDLKLNFEATLDEYSKFVSGLDPKQIPLNQIRATFEGFATAARVGRLSTDEFSGVMRALTQIFSKQKLQAEELTGQLGDRLPGAVKRTADALKISTAELTKQIEQGQVSYKAAILLANELYTEYGKNVSESLKAPDAALADFQNTVTDIKKEVADSGFIQALTDGLKELNTELKKPETKAGIKALAQAFTELIKAGVWIVQNFDKVATVLAAVFGTKIVLSVVNLTLAVRANIVALEAWAVKATAAGVSGAGLIGVFAKIIRAASALALAFSAGFGIGTYLNNNYEAVQKFGATLVGVFEKSLITLRKFKNFLTTDMSWAEVSKQAEIEAGKVDDTITQMFLDIESKFANNGKSKVLDPAAEKKAAEDINRELNALLGPDELAKLRKEALTGNKQMTAEQIDSLRNSISDALTQIDKEIQEKSADTLQQRLDAINLEYDKLIDKINKAKAAGLTGIDYKGAQAAIDQVVAIKQVQEIEKEVNRLIEERRNNVAAINELSADGAITIEEATKRINTENARVLPQMNEALAKARQIAGTINSKPINQAVGNLESKAVLDQQRASKEQIVALEARLNAELDLRREKIQTINALVQSHTITEAEGKQQIIALNDTVKLQTDDMITQLEQMILANDELAKSFFGQEMLERIKQARIELTNVKEEVVNAADLNQTFASGFTNAFQSFISGAQSAKQAFGAFISDFLIKIAEAILQAAILKAITGSISGGGGGIGGAIATGIGKFFHTGGIVGKDGRTGRVPVTAFATAVKYHSGGIAGLKPNEVPAVLQKGEEVLTRNDPRHIMNGGNGNPTQVKIVNAIDSPSMMKEALNTSDGQKAFINFVRANKSSIKSVLA